MNRKLLTGVYTAASLLVGMSSAAPALADGRDAAGVAPRFFTGTQNLGFAGQAMDVWEITCPFPTNRVTADVFDIGPVGHNPAFLKVTIFKDFLPSVSAFDNNGGGASPQISLFRGSGVYHIAFRKTSTGFESYNSIFNCRSGNLFVTPSNVPNKVVDE